MDLYGGQKTERFSLVFIEGVSSVRRKTVTLGFPVWESFGKGKKLMLVMFKAAAIIRREVVL